MKAIVWKNEALGAEWEYKDIPEDLKEISQKYRTRISWNSSRTRWKTNGRAI